MSSYLRPEAALLLLYDDPSAWQKPSIQWIATGCSPAIVWAEHCDCSLLYPHNGITLGRFFYSLFSSSTRTSTHTVFMPECECLAAVHWPSSHLCPTYLPIALCNDASVVPILDVHFCFWQKNTVSSNFPCF